MSTLFTIFRAKRQLLATLAVLAGISAASLEAAQWLPFDGSAFKKAQTKAASTNAILHVPAKTDERRMTWATFTDPELVYVGQGEDELKRQGAKYAVYRFPFAQFDRAITESETTGLVKAMLKQA